MAKTTAGKPVHTKPRPKPKPAYKPKPKPKPAYNKPAPPPAKPTPAPVPKTAAAPVPTKPAVPAKQAAAPVPKPAPRPVPAPVPVKGAAAAVGNNTSASIGGPVGFYGAERPRTNVGAASVPPRGPLPPTAIYGRPGVPTGGRVTSRVDPGSPAALGLQGQQNRVAQALQAAQLAQSIARSSAISQATRKRAEAQLPRPPSAMNHPAERAARPMTHPTEFGQGGGGFNTGGGGGMGGGGGGIPVATPTTPTTPTAVPGTPTPTPTTPTTPTIPSNPRNGLGTFGQDQRRRFNRGPMTSLSLTPEMLRAMASRRFGGT